MDKKFSVLNGNGETSPPTSELHVINGEKPGIVHSEPVGTMGVGRNFSWPITTELMLANPDMFTEEAEREAMGCPDNPYEYFESERNL